MYLKNRFLTVSKKVILWLTFHTKSGQPARWLMVASVLSGNFIFILSSVAALKLSIDWLIWGKYLTANG